MFLFSCLCFYLTCVFIFLLANKADGFHYRQPWVIGVQEEIERLSKRVEEAEQVIKGVPMLNYQIDTVEVSELQFPF